MPMDAAPVWPGFSKRESERSLSLQFSSADVARSIPGYSASGARAERRLQAGFFSPTSQDLAQRDANKKRVHYDIWYALGDYRTRSLEPITGTGLIRVYPLAGGSTWMVVTRAPDTERRDSHLQNDFWIATCSYAGPQHVRNCSVDTDVGRFSVSLNLAEADLPLREKIASYVVETLKTWQVPCAG